MFKQLILSLVLILSSLNAVAGSTDDEANQQLLDSCEVYRRNVNSGLVSIISGNGGVQVPEINVGKCAVRLGGGRAEARLFLPDEFNVIVYDGNRPTELRIVLHDGPWSRDFIKYGIKIYWSYEKFPRHNNLGNIVGYDYQFHQDDTWYGLYSYSYRISNAQTNRVVGSLRISKNPN
jgi:hypothetical protein